MRSKRIDEIVDYIYRNKTLTLDQICQQFHISKSTLRRDLNAILSAGDIEKIYGGVTVSQRRELVSFDERNIKHPEEKKRIASAAAQLIENGDVIFIDSGTTTLHLLEAISDLKNITVLTNNLEIIIRAVPFPNISVISLSGVLMRETFSFAGTNAAQVLQNYNISKAFMAASGFSAQNGVMNSSPLETDIKITAIERSRQVYLLADSSKCNAVSLMTYCDLGKVDTLVTDAEPSPEIRESMEKSGGRILIAP